MYYFKWGVIIAVFFFEVVKDMARGIIIFGSAGSGKTTLGKMVADKLGFPYFDIDDYIWKKRY
uniref:shikimate kinase n=1 Tax=Clostridium sp. NkU-1 TaxID=1095009 RepID=UPI003260E19C